MAQSSETTQLLAHVGQTGQAADIPQSSNGSITGHQYGTSRTSVSITSTAVLTDGKLVATSRIAEARILLQYAAPLILTYALQYSYSFVTVLVAGQLGTNELAAASLASMTANITGLAIYEGLATCLDTLTSQAFGANKKLLVGLHVQRMVLLVLAATVPIGAVWLSSPWILAKLVPEQAVAQLAGDFLRFYLLGAPFYGIFEALKRFTQAQADFLGPMLVVLVCAPLNVFWNWLLVFYLGLGFRGAGIAVSITMICQPLLFLLYIHLFAPTALECWPGVQLRKCFQNWGPMVKLSIPGVFVVLSEWLAFDVLTFSSSYLSTRHLAAQSVLMTVAVMIYHIPFPTGVAASTRFGNLIGYGDVAAARVAFNTHYLVFFGIGAFDMILLTSMRHGIAQAFTADPTVRALIVAVLPIVAAAQTFDAMSALSNGLMRGLGKQHVAGWVNMCVYYLFAVPLSLVLTFGPPHMALLGLWTGPLIGLGICAFSLYVYMRMYDWKSAVQEARDREE